MVRVYCAIAVAFVLASASSAFAQSLPRERGFVSINGGYRVSSNDFQDRGHFRANAEEGNFDTEYRVASGPAFDVFGGFLITPRSGVGAGVSRYSRSTPVAFVGSVPHPFFFNRPRSVSREVIGLHREELALHVQMYRVLSLSRTLQVTFSAGPSFFRTRQGVVTGFVYGDAYPYDEASFQRAETMDVTSWTAGFNAAGDFAVFFTPQMGVGFSAQYAGATGALQSAAGGTHDVKVGGVSTGAGLRFRF